MIAVKVVNKTLFTVCVHLTALILELGNCNCTQGCCGTFGLHQKTDFPHLAAVSKRLINK